MIKTRLSSHTIIEESEVENSFFIEYFDNKHNDKLSICRSNYHRIFLISEGSDTLHIDDMTFHIDKSQLFLIRKGQLYGFNSNSTMSGYELVFGDCFWERAPQSANNCKAVLFNSTEINQLLLVDQTNYQALQILFHTMYQEYSTKEYSNKLDVLAAYLKIIMIKIANLNALLPQAFDSHEKQLYRKYLELVSLHYKVTHEVAYFSDLLDISTRRLSDICKRCGDIGAKEIINNQIISESKRLLQFSSSPIKEIAYELNFFTPEQFSHFFKKNTLLPPNEYRRQFLNRSTLSQ